MAYQVKQIKNLMNDIVEDLTGQSSSIQTANTSDVVSLGKAISDLNLYEGFFGSLINRLAKTAYMVRVYEGADTRKILRDEHEYGAFIQRVYYTAPAFVDNPEYKIPQYSGADISTYQQSSPYDVAGTVTVQAMLYGAQGTYSLEIIRPVDQIRSAFLSEAEMIRFIDGIYVTIENEMKLAEEGLVNAACATAIAADIQGGKVRNLLTEYNTINSSNPITDEDVALSDPDFLKYASKEIRKTIKFMRKMSTAFNVKGYKTFTPSDRLVCEVLTEMASAMDTYLESDTFHKELVALPAYDEVPYWQFQGQSGGAFADTSKIDVTNSGLITQTNLTGNVSDSGIVAFVHDIEHVAACFGHMRTWEKYNERDDVYIHGENARKGYAVDLNQNGVVFQVKYVAPTP